MPYIADKFLRLALDNGDASPSNVGELTYVLYKTCLDYLERSGGRYADYAEVMGALTSTGQEFYRRCVGPYEDAKIEMNGDVNGEA